MCQDTTLKNPPNQACLAQASPAALSARVSAVNTANDSGYVRPLLHLTYLIPIPGRSGKPIDASRRAGGRGGSQWDSVTTKVTAAQDKQKREVIHKTRKRIELTSFLLRVKQVMFLLRKLDVLMIKQRFRHEERNPRGEYKLLNILN
jgi:hypothetical protein